MYQFLKIMLKFRYIKNEKINKTVINMINLQERDLQEGLGIHGRTTLE